MLMKAARLHQVSDAVTARLTGSIFRQNLSESPWTSAAVVPEVDAQGRVVGSIYASPTETRAAIGPDGQNYFNPAVLPFQGFLFSPNNDGHRAPGASWFGYLNESDYTVDTGTLLFPLQPSFTDRRTNTLWAGKAQLEYRPFTGLLVYGGVNRGVKAGSYNGKLFDGTPALAPNQIPYKPEVLTSLEGGLKYTGPGGAYTLNGTFFHYSYKNYQSFVFSDISGFVQNRDARTNGVELEATFRLLDSIRVGLNGSYVDAKVKDLQIAPGVFRDTRPTYTPKYSGSANVRYTYPNPVMGGELGFGAMVSYQSSFYQNARNFASQLFDSRTLVDLSADWTFNSGLSLSAYLRNLTDKRYKQVGLDLGTGCGCNLEAYGMPRTWGVSVGYKF